MLGLSFSLQPSFLFCLLFLVGCGVAFCLLSVERRCLVNGLSARALQIQRGFVSSWLSGCPRLLCCGVALCLLSCRSNGLGIVASKLLNWIRYSTHSPASRLVTRTAAAAAAAGSAARTPSAACAAPAPAAAAGGREAEPPLVALGRLVRIRRRCMRTRP